MKLHMIEIPFNKYNIKLDYNMALLF